MLFIFLKKNFSQYINDYNSYSSFSENIKLKKKLNFIFLPQVDDLKIKTNKKILESINENQTQNLNIGNQKNSSKKKKFVSIKHFEESFEEPLVKKIKDEENEENEIENNSQKKNNIILTKKKIGNKTIKNDEEKFKSVT